MDPWNYISVCMKSLNIPLPHASNIFDSNISTVDTSLWNTDSNCPLSPVLTVSLNKSLPFYCCFLLWYLLWYYYSASDILRFFTCSPCPLEFCIYFSYNITAALCLLQWNTELHLCSSLGFAAGQQKASPPLWGKANCPVPCGGDGLVALVPWEPPPPGRAGESRAHQPVPSLAAGSPPIRVCQLCLYHIFVPFNCFG